MIGVLLLTLRELRAKWIVVGLFAVATLIWLTMALALQLDVVDGSLAGARLFGQEMSDNDFEEPDSGESLDSRQGPTAEADSAVALPPADSLEASGEAPRDTQSTATPEAQAPDTSGAAAPEASEAATPEDTTPEASASDPGDAEPDLDDVFSSMSLLEQIVIGPQVFVAGAAYWIGILLALFATGGLVASLQTRGEVDLLLSKPLARWQILLGRLSGVWLVALGLLVYLIGAVWLVMSLKSGVWNPKFLLSIGVIWAMFAVLYSIVSLTSVTTGSSALSLMVVLAVLFATLVLSFEALDTQVSSTWRPVVIGLRHALPRFPTVGTSLVPQLVAGGTVGGLGAFGTSLGIGALLYALSFWRFARKDF
ncbi:MAG: ABC transporter permease subunit [Bacteroidota bacterium]